MSRCRISGTGPVARTAPPGARPRSVATGPGLRAGGAPRSAPPALKLIPQRSLRRSAISDPDRLLIFLPDDGIVVVMPTTRRVKSSRETPQARRQRVRKRALRPSQILVPDVRSKAFAREAHRQSLAVARSPHAADDQAFVDATSEWNDE